MQREYAQKFEHAIIELEEEFAKNIKSYENIGRQKANASLEHELREIVKTRFNEGDKAIELDRLIYTQTLKRKLIDYHTELRKEHELVRQVAINIAHYQSDVALLIVEEIGAGREDEGRAADK